MKSAILSLSSFLVTLLTFLNVGETFCQSTDHDYTIHEIAAMESRRWSLDEAKGNETYNGENYDWKYAECFWEIDPWEKYIVGRILHTIEITSVTESITFDMNDALTVNEVRVDGITRNAFFENNLSLNIELGEILPIGTILEVEINYEGEPVPNDTPSFYQSFHGASIPEIFTLSEPYGSRDWWPCKHTLVDKLDSVFIELTVPNGNKAGSNGKLLYENNNGDGTVSFGWHHSYPIPAYLISLAVTNYAEFSQFVETEETDIHILTYAYPEQMESAQEKSEVTPEIMALFSELFGLYPYADEKYGHAQTTIGGGMEHTTMSTMGSFSYGLIAHELAHQWFGDKLTCGSWSDIWLNEGFATYATGLTSEFLGSEEEWFDWKSSNISSTISQPDGSVYVYDTLSRDRVFNGRLTYQKGALVLHMLRGKLGDDLFFEGVRQYLNHPENAFGYVKTPDFQQSMESVSGKNLDEFFQDWVYHQGYPKYELVWWPVNGGIAVQVNQQTSHPSVSFFEMPVQILVVNEDSDSLYTLNNEFNGQIFILNTGPTVSSVHFDPNLWLMAEGFVRYDAENEYPDIAVVPNPAVDNIWVSILRPNFSADRFEIIDAQGKIVDTSEPVAGIRSSFQWNVSDYRAGIYVIRFVSEKTTTSVTFVKI